MNRLSLFFLSFLFASVLSGQTSLFDQFIASGDTVILSLETDWKTLVREKKRKKYQQLDIAFSLNGKSYQLKGKIRSRGNIRLEVCSNPSLKIKLKKDQLQAGGFSKNNNLKLVQQCSNSSLGQNYLRRERLVYELHQVYSEHFHRTVPVILRVKDQEDIFAFFVEEEEQLAIRYGRRVMEQKTISTRALDRSAYVNLCLFNYLVLNTDWAIFNRHNVEMVADTSSGKIIPIPYDFDYSGFVGTSYAVPREELNVSSIYTPKWLGKDVSPEELKAGAEHFIKKSDLAKALIEGYPDLKDNDRRRMLKRLEDFNELLRNEKKLLKLLR